MSLRCEWWLTANGRVRCSDVNLQTLMRRCEWLLTISMSNCLLQVWLVHESSLIVSGDSQSEDESEHTRSGSLTEWIRCEW